MKMASQKAEALLRNLQIHSLPVDPFMIAERHDIAVTPKSDAAKGVSGMLLRHGNEFGILYATHIGSNGFQRFSVAHELGHYFLDGHIDHVLAGKNAHVSQAGFVSADPYEMEADSFAAGLLMPANLFCRALLQHDPGLKTVEAVARLCRTSLTATAIRYTALSDDAVAVIVSTGATIDYCFMSALMRSVPQITWPKKGTPIPKSTITAEFNADSGRIAGSTRADAESDIMDWLGGEISVPATEEVIGLGSYGKTLTILTCPSLVDEAYRDEEGDEEGNLVHSWTPHFKR